MNDPTQLLGMSGLIAALVAFLKGFIPEVLDGDLPGLARRKRIVMLLVAGVTAGVMALALTSQMISGTPYELVVEAVGLAGTAIGMREGLGAIPGVGDRLSRRR